MSDPNIEGLGAFVPLDYDSRYEHAIVLISSTWDSMFELIRAPGKFIEDWRAKYASTPTHEHNKDKSKDWRLVGPITIIIEPLAIPSPANAVLLESLETLYPGLKAVARIWWDSSPSVFYSGIKSKNVSGGHWDSLKVNAGTASFEMKYIVEFALKTRTVTIKYLPHIPTQVGTFTNQITTMTVNPALNTNLTFLHFDVEFPVGYTRNDVATQRARFAMNYITDPNFLDQLVPPKTLASKSHFKGTSDTTSKNTLTLNLGASAAKPKITAYSSVSFAGSTSAPYPFQPRILIDSVWPDPMTGDVDINDNVVPGTPPVPPLCTVIITVQDFDINGNPIQVQATNANGVPQVNDLGQPIMVNVYHTEEVILKAYSPLATKRDYTIYQLESAIAHLAVFEKEKDDTKSIQNASKILKAKLSGLTKQR